MKLYKNSKYDNKRKKDIRTFKKRVLALSGIGIIVLCGINLMKLPQIDINFIFILVKVYFVMP